MQRKRAEILGDFIDVCRLIDIMVEGGKEKKKVQGLCMVDFFSFTKIRLPKGIGKMIKV